MVSIIIWHRKNTRRARFEDIDFYPLPLNIQISKLALFLTKKNSGMPPFDFVLISYKKSRSTVNFPLSKSGKSGCILPHCLSFLRSLIPGLTFLTLFRDHSAIFSGHTGGFQQRYFQKWPRNQCLEKGVTRAPERLSTFLHSVCMANNTEVKYPG